MKNIPYRLLFLLLMPVLLAFRSGTAEQITEDQIRDVIEATDAAARERDVEIIGDYLSDAFERVIEVPHKKWIATVRINKHDYLGLIGDGWAGTMEYDYHRDNTVIHVMPDGQSGHSYSTVTENVTREGDRMTSRFREYAYYGIENGRPVITRISGHTLVGDTTPASGQ